MKKFLLITLAGFMSAGQISAIELEHSLSYRSCDVSNSEPFVKPLDDINLTFGCAIKLFDGASASIKCDGQTVADAVALTVENYDGETRKEGRLTLSFEKQNLPAGKTYTLSIPKGILGWVEMHNDIQIVNQTINVDFSVPADLGPGKCGVTYYESTEYTDFGFNWPYDVKAVGNPMVSLYREGEKIGEYPVVTDDAPYYLDAYIDFTDLLYFDRDVNFSVVLPQGSVCSVYRDDLVNKETVVEFVGVYDDPNRPLRPILQSREWDLDRLDEVTFAFSRSFSIANGAFIELWEGHDCERLVKKAAAYINHNVNCFALSANFEGEELISEKGYTLVIPEGIIATCNDDFESIINERCEIKINNSSGIENIFTDRSSASPVFDLQGRRVSNPVAGKIYISNGVKFILK